MASLGGVWGDYVICRDLCAGQKYPPRGAPGQVEEKGERRVAFRDRRQNDSEAPLGYSIER